MGNRLGGLTNRLPGVGGQADGFLSNTKEAIKNLVAGVQEDLKGLASNAKDLPKDQVSSLTKQLERFVQIVQNALEKGLGETIQSLYNELGGLIGGVAGTLQQLLSNGIHPRRVLPQTINGVTGVIGAIVSDLGNYSVNR